MHTIKKIRTKNSSEFFRSRKFREKKKEKRSFEQRTSRNDSRKQKGSFCRMMTTRNQQNDLWWQHGARQRASRSRKFTKKKRIWFFRTENIKKWFTKAIGKLLSHENHQKSAKRFVWQQWTCLEKMLLDQEKGSLKIKKIYEKGKEKLFSNRELEEIIQGKLEVFYLMKTTRN